MYYVISGLRSFCREEQAWEPPAWIRRLVWTANLSLPPSLPINGVWHGNRWTSGPLSRPGGIGDDWFGAVMDSASRGGPMAGTVFSVTDALYCRFYTTVERGLGCMNPEVYRG